MDSDCQFWRTCVTYFYGLPVLEFRALSLFSAGSSSNAYGGSCVEGASSQAE